MKSVVAAGLALLCLLMLSSNMAEAANLRIFSDAAFSDSTLTDDTPRIVTLYVVHTDFEFSVGVRFATSAGAGFTGVWLGDTTPFTHIGTSPIDISVAYGICHLPPVLVLTMSYQLFGTSEACSTLRIVPPKGLLGIPCDDGCFGEHACNGESLRVNCPVASESTTWGRIKALYRD